MWTTYDGGHYEIFLCLHELQRIMISVDDCLLHENVIPPLVTGLYNGVNLFVVSGVLTDSI
jgi:hypothetical protein